MTVYLDHNASTPPRPEAIEAMLSVLTGPAGNPSSMHAGGRAQRCALDRARRQVAAAVGARARDVVFTSGATESNNLAIRGVVGGWATRGGRPRIVTTAVEHASILHTLDRLAGKGAGVQRPAADAQDGPDSAVSERVENEGLEVHRVAVDGNGVPDYAALERLTAERPALLTIAWANGETGHVADIGRVLAVTSPTALVHVDAAQALGRTTVRWHDGIDLMTLSSHKIGGPPGVGALLVGERCRTLLSPLVTGGSQEWGLRAGTENVAAAAGMGVAVELAVAELPTEQSRLLALRERLAAGLAARVDGLLRITPSDGLANTLTVAVLGLGSDSMIAALDLAGFAVSSGSACAAASPEPSHVIEALGVAPSYRDGVLRISMGRTTAEDDVLRFAEAFADVVGRARKAA